MPNKLLLMPCYKCQKIIINALLFMQNKLLLTAVLNAKQIIINTLLLMPNAKNCKFYKIKFINKNIFCNIYNYSFNK